MAKNHDLDFDQPASLMETTIRLIKEDPRSLLELYRDTGVPYHWLQHFVSRKFVNPGVNRIQFLYEVLSGQKLFPEA